MNKRLDYLDSIRFFAIASIFMVHFIDFANQNYFTRVMFWLNLVGSDTGLAFFFVLLGFFACATTKSTKQVIIKRYFQFTVNVLLVYLFIFFSNEIVAKLFFATDQTAQQGSLFDFAHIANELSGIINNVLVLNTDSYSPTLWSLTPLFFAGMLVLLLSKFFKERNKYQELAACFIIFLILLFAQINDEWGSNLYWVSFSLLGYATKIISDMNYAIFKNKYFNIGLVLAFFVLNYLDMPFLLEVSSFCLFILAVIKLPTAQKILAVPPLPFLGKLAFYIYIWHMPMLYATYELFTAIGLLNITPYAWSNPDTNMLLFLITIICLTMIAATINYFLYDKLFVPKVVEPLFAQKNPAPNIEPGKKKQ